MQQEQQPRSVRQNQLNEIIFGTETTAGKTFDIALIIIISLSSLIVILDSANVLNIGYHRYLITIEWFFTILFSFEYIARLYCSPHPSRYAKSFYGLIDLLSIVPAYLAVIYSGAQYFLILRLLRVLRLFRVLKLLRFAGDANILTRSLWQSRRKILIFLFTVIIFATVFGAFMFVVEGPEHGFDSIPESIYWAIVTITTVGYGDISPQTALGKLLASFVMVLGYAIIAVPTGILTAELANEMRLDRSTNKCHHCGRSGHDNDAMHCKFCGNQI